MRLFDSADFSFIERRKGAYVLSAALILAGVAAMLVNVARIGSWQNYGVDFTGGAVVHVQFENEVGDSDIREALGSDAYQVTPFRGENAFMIRAPVPEGDEGIDETRLTIEGGLEAQFGVGAFTIESTDLVGPKIGEELQAKAGLAILFSFLLTLVYLAIRFEARFGFAAIVATVHDILITLGFLAVFRIEIALPTVAAILTIVGYSLNDTIVVFDRIRENLGKKGARKEDPIALVNRSINETLPRTVLTSGTTLAVLLALVIRGPAVILDFSMVLILGVLIGTYSSIFIASPALLEIQNRFGVKKEGKRARRPQPA